MPCCSVVICKNSSRNVTYVKDGISFHTFPATNPNMKEKWIDATGRKSDWFPTKNCTICSVHFAPKCFRPSTKLRRLFDWAVPTLRLRVAYYTEPSSSKESDYSELDIKKEPKEEELDDPLFLPASVPVDSSMETQSEDLASEQHEINESPRKQLRDYIISKNNLIKMQQMKIRTLQKRCSRYQKRIAELKDVCLKNKRDISPVMVNKSQQVNFMYNIPKSTSVPPSTGDSAGGTHRREPLGRDASGKQTSETCPHGS